MNNTEPSIVTQIAQKAIFECISYAIITKFQQLIELGEKQHRR